MNIRDSSRTTTTTKSPLRAGRDKQTINNNMRYDWIEIAMENGADMKITKGGSGYIAIMKFKTRRRPLYNKPSIQGDEKSCFIDAITSLNLELEDDAADECQC